MTRLIFSNLIRTKEAILLFCFSLFPVLLPVVNLFNTNFMQLNAPVGSMDFLTFFGAVMKVQYDIILPMIILVYLTITVFYAEANTGTLFLYKDISRTKVFLSKVAALSGVYLIYALLTFVFSLVTYYLYLIHLPYTSGRFLPPSFNDASMVFDIIGTVFACLLCILVAAVVSQRCGVGVTMLVSILYVLVSQLAPLLGTLCYFLPNAYGTVAEHLGNGPAFMGSLALFLFYSIILTVYGNHAYKTLEY